MKDRKWALKGFVSLKFSTFIYKVLVEEVLYLNPNHNVAHTERHLICQAGLSHIYLGEWKKGKISSTDSTCSEKRILGLLLLYPPPHPAVWIPS